MKDIIPIIVLITAVFSTHTCDLDKSKESLDGWSKIFRACTPHQKTFFTNKDGYRCIICHDLERGTYQWTRILINSQEESFNVEEVVVSQDPLDIFKKMETQYLKEQEEKTNLLDPLECLPEAQEQA